MILRVIFVAAIKDRRRWQYSSDAPEQRDAANNQGAFNSRIHPVGSFRVGIKPLSHQRMEEDYRKNAMVEAVHIA